MDELRWILLGLGVVLIVAVYFWGRSQNKTSLPLDDTTYEAPSFSAKEDDDQWVDGVGPVRVVSVEDPVEPVSEIDVVSDDMEDSEQTASTVSEDINTLSEAEENSSDQPAESAEPVSIDDVLSLFLVVPKDKVINGEHIYSACLGNNLQYGDMKIFHRINDDGETVFSLSDMKRPGWFELEQINDHKTRGISLFTQLSRVSDPVRALDDMLLCAYSMANLLGAQLCGQDRMLLNESTVKLMREKARRFENTGQPLDV